MAFDPLEYLKKNRDIEQESVFDPTAYLSKNSPQDIPTDEEFGEIKGYQEPTRELSLYQKAINKAGELMSGGGLKVYSEYATPEDIEYEKQSKIKALAEVPYSIAGDLAALASSGAGEVAEIFGAEDKTFGQRISESVYRPEISEKGQNYKEKFLENLQALGPFSGDLGALSRLKPVSGVPNQVTYKVATKTAEQLAKGEKAIRKGVDLTKTNLAHIYNSLTPVKTAVESGKDVLKSVANKMKIEPNRATAEYFMSSALKPTIAQHRSGAGNNAVKYMLENKLNPTNSGVNFIEKDLTKLNKQVDNIIELNKNKTIRKTHIFNNLDDVRDKFAKQVDNEADLKAFDGVINRFKNRFKGRTINTKLAHEMKKNTYKQLNKKYGEMKSAEVEAQKTIARLLKEEVERTTSKNGINQIKDLNDKITKTFDTLDVVTRRKFMDSNKDTFHGLSLLAHDPVVGTIQHFQATGLAKSLLAKPFYKMAKDAPVSRYAGGLITSPLKMDNINRARAYSLLGPDQE